MRRADAVIGPFAEFFRVYGWLALLMLAMISLYRLPSSWMGPMAILLSRPRFVERRRRRGPRSIGLIASLLGIAAGGLSAYASAISDADRRDHPAEQRRHHVCHPRVHGS
jgi:hypothetical protein